MENEEHWQHLHSYGFRFVLCNKEKQPIQKEWLTRPYPKWHVVKAHHESGGLLGVVPGSMPWWVLDQDYGTREELLPKIPQVAFSVNSSVSTKWHHWFKLPKTGTGKEISGKAWQIGPCKGHIRATSSQVIVWDPKGVYEGITKHFNSKPCLPSNVRGLLPKAPKAPQRTGAPHMRVREPRGKGEQAATAVVRERVAIPPPSNIAGQYIQQEIQRMRDAAEGERNHLLNVIVWDAYRKGLATDDFEDQILDAATDAGLDEGEALATINSARRGGLAERGDDAETMQQVMQGGVLGAVIDNADNGGVKGFVYEDMKLSTIEQALKDIGFQLRFNTLSSRQEAKKVHANEWKDISNGGGSLRRELEDRCMLKRSQSMAPFTVLRHRFKELMEVLEEDEEYHVDPVAEWKKALPVWDQKPRLATIFHDALGTRKDSLASWAGFYMFASPLIRAASNGGEGYSLDQMLFLVGPHGNGKSKFIRESLPASLRGNLVNQDYDPAWDEKRQVEAIMGKFFVEAGELQITKNFSVNRLKAFLSTTKDETRLAYKERTQMYPRSATLIATVNEDDGVPDDWTGNRRFIPLFCPGINHTQEQPDGGYHVHDYWNNNRDQVWAEAFIAAENIMDGTMTLRMTPETIRLRDTAYGGARQRDEHLEDVMGPILLRLEGVEHKRSEFPDPNEELPGVKLTHVLEAVHNLHVSPYNIEQRTTRLLRRLGYRPKKISQGANNPASRRWVLQS